jgi:two-component system sensor histidine kinase KdpD
VSERADDGPHDPAAPSARSRRYLDAARRAREGRLKIYLGPAAGVGKTYRMLQEAHELKRRGVDVVIGYVETHARAETEALVHGLEQVPLRTIHYRGLDLRELDVDAVVKRAPKVVLVDELAHTNAPGSARRRRFEDALALLRAGIDVIGALNVQHLESLNDVVHRATGTRVRETVPDSFLKRADEIVDVDLPPADLLARLRAGKVYDRERATWALANFFKPENLTVLRELALREVAESLERSPHHDRARRTPRSVA